MRWIVFLFLFNTICVTPARIFAQEADWVEIEAVEEQYFLVRDAPDVSFNDRIYRFEIAGTNFYEDDKLLELTIWSDEFVPDAYVRETTSASGMAGNGEIIARAEYERNVQNGRTYHVMRLRFQPPQSGKYRVVVTSRYDIADQKNASSGAFNLVTKIYQWRVPEPVVAEPEPAGQSCAVLGTDASPSMWSDGEYGAVFTRADDGRFQDRSFRFHGLGTTDFEKAQRDVTYIAGVYPDMTFVELMSRSEACEYVARSCRAVRSFADYCGDLGMPIPPEP